jgi:membrane protein YqaA with SNARE-associated domain
MEWLEGLGLFGLFLGTFLAATVVPFSSDALYLAILAATGDPVSCLIVGSLGNWLGSVVTYWMGWLAKWEWLEKWFKVKPETLARQKKRVDKYGVWLALTAWIPFIGDVIAIALGFYRTRPGWTRFLRLVGNSGGSLFGNLVYGWF